MTGILDATALQSELAQLSGWSGDPKVIRRSVTLTDFLSAIQLVNAVAEVAEELDHHPDIDIRWRAVTFTLSTHSAGGVTNRDLELARRIDELVTAAEAEQ